MDVSDHALWSRLRLDGDSGAREALYLLHTPWATAIARRVHRRFIGLSADREDFIQNANIGLLEAIDRFDPARGIAFRAYATARVRGAVFNGVRAILGDSDHALRLDERVDSFGDGGASAFENVIESVIGLGLGYMLDDLARERVTDIHDGLSYMQRDQTASQVARAVEGLPPRLRALVIRHYFEFTPFTQLAEEWGVTKGRISQLHRAALVALRARLIDYA